ncbi:MAG: hypothetical protein ACRCU3_08385 [Eubacteriaceae bacterium]
MLFFEVVDYIWNKYWRIICTYLVILVALQSFQFFVWLKDEIKVWKANGVSVKIESLIGNKEENEITYEITLNNRDLIKFIEVDYNDYHDENDYVRKIRLFSNNKPISVDTSFNKNKLLETSVCLKNTEGTILTFDEANKETSFNLNFKMKVFEEEILGIDQVPPLISGETSPISSDVKTGIDKKYDYFYMDRNYIDVTKENGKHFGYHLIKVRDCYDQIHGFISVYIMDSSNSFSRVYEIDPTKYNDQMMELFEYYRNVINNDVTLKESLLSEKENGLSFYGENSLSKLYRYDSNANEFKIDIERANALENEIKKDVENLEKEIKNSKWKKERWNYFEKME